jgi:threonine synthase
MDYISTRGGAGIASAEAIVRGLAADGGLYLPEELPRADWDFKERLPYKDIAHKILRLYLSDFSDEEIRFCVDAAYDDKFDTPDFVNLQSLKNDKYILELFHGNTSAFKDMALSILPHLLTTALKKTGEERNVAILAATSGDTGKAALAGFADVSKTKVIVFYPKDGITEIQKRQMTTQEGSNVYVFGIDGNFDDAQKGVKGIFEDKDLLDAIGKQSYIVSSANSINIGRLIPQIVYYFYAYSRISGAEGMNVSVPTGNFGNILAAYIAKRMGLPIKKLIVSSNRNNVLTDFFNTGIYETKRDFFVTNSPSMDIIVSSNLERLLYFAQGNTSEIMSSLRETGRFETKLRFDDFYADFGTEVETLETIAAVYNEQNYLMDTHTAVAYNAQEKYAKKTGDETPVVIAGTASPYKFPRAIAEAIGIPMDGKSDFELLKDISKKTNTPIPNNLKNLDKKPELHSSTIKNAEMEKSVLASIEDTKWK